MRLLGLLLLVALLARLDAGAVYEAMRRADLRLILLAVLLDAPLIFLKTLRWQGILRAQAIDMPVWPAFLAYFGSLFIGFLTPGRLGEFVKAVHVTQDCGASSGQAFASVLADRLFDLYALVLVGGAALLALSTEGAPALALVGLVVALTAPLALFLHPRAFGWLQRQAGRLGGLAARLFAEGGWLAEMRAGIMQLRWPTMVTAVLLTALAYALFFGQCYLLALALGLPVSYVTVSYAVALGSLVTLIPISISGLGTREAVMIAYLGAAGIAPEPALTFSLLVFATFYLAGGLMGAVAWWLKPVNLKRAEAFDPADH